MSLSTGGGGTQRAFLIRQKSTGEEVVVTMSSLKSPVGARAVVNRWVGKKTTIDAAVRGTLMLFFCAKYA